MEAITYNDQLILARRVAAGDLGARDQLVTSHLKVAKQVARKCYDSTLDDLDDLEADAFVALVKAAETFRPERNPGVPFSAWAAIVIRSRVLDARRRYRRARRRHEPLGNRMDRPVEIDPSRDLMAREIVAGYLAKITERQREVVSAIYSLGSATDPLSTVLDRHQLNARKARNLACRAVARMRVPAWA